MNHFTTAPSNGHPSRPANTASLLKVRNVALALGISGLSMLLLGFVAAPARAFTSLLTGAWFVLGLGVGGLALMSLHLVANAGWYVVVKRTWEGFAAALVVGAALLVLATGGGLSVLYEWARPEASQDHLLHLKAAYLNRPFFFVRMAAILATWFFFAHRLRRLSRAQDAAISSDVARKLNGRAVAWAAAFLVLGAITVCLAAFDWLMSLEARWFSTIFGLYNIAGVLASTVTATIIAVVLLSRAGLLPQLNQHHLHDLGKLMFGFCTFWAYLWISQFLLIWYTNIPEETQYYEARWRGGWLPLFILVPILHWAAPFFALLRRKAKHSPKYLLVVGTIMLLGRWLDLWLMTAPANLPLRPAFGVFELAGVVGPVGLFVFGVTRVMSGVPLFAARDPYAGESLHHHG